MKQNIFFVFEIEPKSAHDDGIVRKERLSEISGDGSGGDGGGARRSCGDEASSRVWRPAESAEALFQSNCRPKMAETRRLAAESREGTAEGKEGGGGGAGLLQGRLTACLLLETGPLEPRTAAEERLGMGSGGERSCRRKFSGFSLFYCSCFFFFFVFVVG